jgi:uncharacterized repeat protein (TIGR03803 family)
MRSVLAGLGYNRQPSVGFRELPSMTITRMKSSFLVAFALLTVSLAHASAEKTVYTFASPGTGDGMYPYCNLVADANGNLYGTTQSGGANGAGMIFELSPSTSGEWVETVLHNFTGQSDGGFPGAGLVSDDVGNLYGTGGYGGANGTGVVFELSPQGNSWSYNVLYSFGAYPGSDGFAPNSALVFDKQGNLYGTTYEGGDDSGCFQGCGTVFELSPLSGGWSERVIHTFAPNGSDGELPSGGVVFGRGGALFGTTQNGGGSNNAGVVYQLRYSKATDTWSETIVHAFSNSTSDGGFPEATLLYRQGVLYGTSEGGGINGHGTVFAVTYSKTSGWTTNVLYSFGQSYSGDVFLPQAGVVMYNGSLYGTTTYGGAYNYYGGVFKLAKSSDGSWSESVLHSFNGTDGDSPAGVLVRYKGWLYGTSPLGGNNTGLVFALRP